MLNLIRYVIALDRVLGSDRPSAADLSSAGAAAIPQSTTQSAAERGGIGSANATEPFPRPAD